MNRNSLLTIMLLGMLISITAPEGWCDGKVIGKVVEYQSTTGIDDVKVTVLHAKNCDNNPKECKVLGSDNTNRDGDFSIDIEYRRYEYPEYINIRYEPRSGDYDSSGRIYIRYVSDSMTVDSIGLTKPKSSYSYESSDAYQRQRESNSSLAVAAGVDERRLPSDVEYLLKKSGSRRSLEIYRRYYRHY